MRSNFLIPVLLSFVSISTTAILFWRSPPKTATSQTIPVSAFDIRWGEGSEAGVPDAAKSELNSSEMSNDEDAFVFAGKCATGEKYRIYAYKKIIHGLAQSYYDYEGPVGKGTVQSEAHPKVIAVRICHKTAEIISSNYWE